DDVGEHATVLGPRERLHAVVGEHGVLVAVAGVSGGAGAARAARDLEGDDDALADLQPANRVTELHRLGDRLVPERKRAAQWKQAGSEEEIDVAACDRERTDQGFDVSLEMRLGDVAPFDGAGPGTRELSHASQLSSASVSRRKRFLRTRDCTRRNRRAYASASTSQSRRATIRGSSRPSGRHTR